MIEKLNDIWQQFEWYLERYLIPAALIMGSFYLTVHFIVAKFNGSI